MLTAAIASVVLANPSCFVEVGLPEIHVTCTETPVEWPQTKLPYRATVNLANLSRTSLSVELGDCPFTSVEYLNLEGNLLSEFPAWSLHFLDIIGLNMGRNHLSAVHASSFAGLTTIKYIDLQHNRITYIANDAFVQMTTLLTLDLRSNWIEEFNYYEVYLSSMLNELALTSINIQNQSNGDPTCLYDKRAVWNSEYSYYCREPAAGVCNGAWACPEPVAVCRPTERPDGIFDLRCYSFDALPAGGDWAGTNPIEGSIRIAHNNLSVIPHAGFSDCPHTGATAIYLNNNSITSVGGHAFASLTLLRTIDLSDNPIEYIVRGAFAYVSALETLLMRNMHLGIFDYQQLKAYHRLSTVDLTNQLYGYADCEGKAAWNSHAEFISSLTRCNPIEPSCPGGDMGCVLSRTIYALAGVELPVAPQADTVATGGIVALAVVIVGILAGYAIHRRKTV